MFLIENTDSLFKMRMIFSHFLRSHTNMKHCILCFIESLMEIEPKHTQNSPKFPNRPFQLFKCEY